MSHGKLVKLEKSRNEYKNIKVDEKRGSNTLG